VGFQTTIPEISRHHKQTVDREGIGIEYLWKYENQLWFMKPAVSFNINSNGLMKQAGDIAKMTSWYSVNLKLGKSLEFVFRSQPMQIDVREGVVNHNTH
jgi:hypothetical protein